jgi:long-chain acyl-CoA synthetase
MSVNGSLAWPLAHAAQLYAGELAVIDGERRLTYAEVTRRVGNLGRSLSDMGIERGAFVGVLAENSLEHLECWLGVPAHGYVLNDLNFRLAVSELAFMVEDSSTVVLFVDAGQLEPGRELLGRCECLRRLVYMGEGACPEDCVAYSELVRAEPLTPPDLGPDTLATVSYTGGTTGRPKGVMLSHGNVMANARHNTMELGYSKRDRYLHAAPMFHVADTSQTFPVTWAGGTHVMLPRFDAQRVATAIEQHGITILVLVPTMLHLLLSEIDRRPVDVSSLRLLIYAAAPITPELQERAMEVLRCDLWQGYGMTEAAPSVTFLSAEDHREGRALRSVGQPIRGVQVEIRDPVGALAETSEIGEICVRGPNVMLGYWNRPEATETALVDGWYRTGDAGYMDADGYVFVVDRLRDMIISGGENVYSVEVEQALVAHPDVNEAAVFGVPNEVWGEAVFAVVVPLDGAVLDEQELISHCRELIAGYKLPRSIQIREQPLPKSGAGKVLKHELRRALLGPG